MVNILLDIGIIVVAAAVCGIAAKILRQPAIIGYILAGIIIGPQVLGIVANDDTIITLSALGIAFLLFIVGLGIRLEKLKKTGLTATVVGTIQVVSTAALTYLIFFKLVGKVTALYFGIAAAFSSTMIVMKLLSDKRETDTLHGRIILGLLLVQDFFAIFALALLPSIKNPAPNIILISILKGVILISAAFAAGRIIKPIMEFAARQKELLMMTALAWCLTMCGLAVYLGYSIAIGAFLAGLNLAAVAYNLEIAAKMKPLKDFFVLMFFVTLGMQLTFQHINLLHVILLIFAVVAIKTAIIAGMLLIKHRKPVAFIAAGAMAQLSEFSLILGITGTALGQISKEALSVIAIVTMLTTVTTSYFIEHSRTITSLIGQRFPTRKDTPKKKYNAILCGYNRIGYGVLNAMKSKNVLVIDYNPDKVEALRNQKINSICADASNPEVLSELDLKNLKLFVSTLPDEDDNTQLIRKVREENKKAVVVLTASQVDDALQLYQEGADYVIMPHFLGGKYASLLLQRFDKKPERILTTRMEHIKTLKKRKETEKAQTSELSRMLEIKDMFKK